MERIPVALIRPGDNDRKVFRDAELAELAASIVAHGLAQPITVRPAPELPSCAVCGYRVAGERCDEHPAADLVVTRYEVVAGERRWRAHRLAGLSEVAALVRDLSDEAAADVMLLENLTRVDLGPMEEARAYQKRIERFGRSVADVAKAANKSPRHVQKRLGLLSLIPEVQQLIESRALPVAYAEAMIALNGWSQAAAVKALSESEGLPTLHRWRFIVGALLEKQSQTAMFDLDSFFRDQLAAADDTPSPAVAPDPRLPPMRPKVTDSTGRALLDYAEQLERDGWVEQAAGVRTALAYLVKLNYVRNV